MVSIPILSSASLVPQSGHIGVWLSALESAGLPAYVFPHLGHTAFFVIVSFISNIPFCSVRTQRYTHIIVYMCCLFYCVNTGFFAAYEHGINVVITLMFTALACRHSL